MTRANNKTGLYFITISLIGYVLLIGYSILDALHEIMYHHMDMIHINNFLAKTPDSTWWFVTILLFVATILAIIYLKDSYRLWSIFGLLYFILYQEEFIVSSVFKVWIKSISTICLTISGYYFLRYIIDERLKDAENERGKNIKGIIYLLLITLLFIILPTIFSFSGTTRIYLIIGWTPVASLVFIGYRKSVKDRKGRNASD